MNEKAVREYLEFIESLINSGGFLKKSYIIAAEVFIIFVCLLAYLKELYLCAVITMIVNIISMIFAINSIRKKESFRAHIWAVAVMSTSLAFMGAAGTYFFLCEIHPTNILYYFGMIGIYLICSLLSIFTISRRANKEGKFKGKKIKFSPAYCTIGYSVGVLIEVFNIGKETDYEANMMIGAAACFALAVFSSMGSVYYYIYYLMKKYDMYS